MYISKAKLMSLIVRNYRQWGDEYDAMQILGDIEDMPEEDIPPVKRGHWVGEIVDGLPEANMWSCSVCGEMFQEWGYEPTWKYCPRCGAKMEV